MSSVLENELFTVRDLQQITKESESTWRRRLASGEVPAMKLGGSVRVRQEDFSKWLEGTFQPHTVGERSHIS